MIVDDRRVIVSTHPSCHAVANHYNHMSRWAQRTSMIVVWRYQHVTHPHWDYINNFECRRWRFRNRTSVEDDDDYVDSTMGGTPFRVSRFAPLYAANSIGSISAWCVLSLPWPERTCQSFMRCAPIRTWWNETPVDAWVADRWLIRSTALDGHGEKNREIFKKSLGLCLLTWLGIGRLITYVILIFSFGTVHAQFCHFIW